jgi:hypothetical protein
MMKNTLTGTIRSSFLLLLAGFLLLFSITPLPAQQTPPLPENPPLPKDLETRTLDFHVQKQSLADVIALLSPQIGHNILADDEPLLKQADIDMKGTVKEVLDKVADTFDYSWSVNKRGVILMVKRFKNPLEHPQMSVPELKQMAQEALRVLKFRKIETAAARNPYLLRVFYASLTGEQKQRLDRGQALLGTELTQAQRDLIEQASLNSSLGDLPYLWGQLAGELNALPASSVQRGDPEIGDALRARMKNPIPDRNVTIIQKNGKTSDPNQVMYCWKDTHGSLQYQVLGNHALLVIKTPPGR